MWISALCGVSQALEFEQRRTLPPKTPVANVFLTRGCAVAEKEGGSFPWAQGPGFHPFCAFERRVASDTALTLFVHSPGEDQPCRCTISRFHSRYRKEQPS
jgi:hypothetical protein